MDGYRLRLASEVHPRDGMALELILDNGEQVTEVFEDDETKERTVKFYTGAPVPLVVVTGSSLQPLETCRDSQAWRRNAWMRAHGSGKLDGSPESRQHCSLPGYQIVSAELKASAQSGTDVLADRYMYR